VAKVKLTGPLFNGKWQKIYENEFRKAMLKATIHVESKVAEKTPVGWTGALRAGIASKVITPFLGRVFPSGPSIKYAPVVEFGRKKDKFPPTREGGSLWMWVLRKLKVPKKQMKSAVFLVARKIARKGTKAVKMFEKTERQEKRKVQQIFNHAMSIVDAKLSDK